MIRDTLSLLQFLHWGDKFLSKTNDNQNKQKHSVASLWNIAFSMSARSGIVPWQCLKRTATRPHLMTLCQRFSYMSGLRPDRCPGKASVWVYVSRVCGAWMFGQVKTCICFGIMFNFRYPLRFASKVITSLLIGTSIAMCSTSDVVIMWMVFQRCRFCKSSQHCCNNND